MDSNARLVKEQKAMNRSLQNLLKDHKKWMRTHKVRLSLHYNMIQKLSDKLK